MDNLENRGAGRAFSALALLLGLATILGAIGFQYIGGYQPCELCYQQRLPYYIGLPALLGVLLIWNKLPQPLVAGGVLLVALVFAWSTYLGAFHSGVEWGFWQGPTACSGTDAAELSFEALSDINSTRVVPCDKPQWRFLGLSFAGYNAMVSLAITGLLIWSAVRVFHTPGPGRRS